MSPGEGILLLIITIVLGLVLLMIRASSPGFKLGGTKTVYTPTSTYTPLPVKTTRKCALCKGRGILKCWSCDGRGGKYVKQYNWVSGSYKSVWQSCFNCDGTGVNTCHVCQGRGYLD